MVEIPTAWASPPDHFRVRLILASVVALAAAPLCTRNAQVEEPVVTEGAYEPIGQESGDGEQHQEDTEGEAHYEAFSASQPGVYDAAKEPQEEGDYAKATDAGIDGYAGFDTGSTNV